MTPTGVRVRVATSADLDAILALERETANAPHWPSSVYAAILQDDNRSSAQRCLLVAEGQGENAEPKERAILGFAAGVAHSGELVAELESVAVADRARRRGIGRALCSAVLAWCRDQGAASVILEVRAGSASAIALYTGLGFVLEGRRPSYYRDPDDDALMFRSSVAR
jgi:ribosomal-protein-alanine N-acetyltransferase